MEYRIKRLALVMELMLELRIQEWVFQQHNDVMHA
jgi:hypothetical protein